MATLRDIITESFDIYVKDDKYFCVPKYGKVIDETSYEMRGVEELEVELGDFNGSMDFEEERELRNLGVIGASTAWIGPWATTAQAEVRRRDRSWPGF